MFKRLFVVGAVLTPSPDIVSQFLLAGPLSVLYLLGVAAAFLFAPRRKPAAGEATAKGLTTHGAP